MAMTKRPKRQYSSEIINLENMIPENHFLRIIEKYFDWNFIYEEVEKQYSIFGRPSIDPLKPVVLSGITKPILSLL